MSEKSSGSAEHPSALAWVLVVGVVGYVLLTDPDAADRVASAVADGVAPAVEWVDSIRPD